MKACHFNKDVKDRGKRHAGIWWKTASRREKSKHKDTERDKEEGRAGENPENKGEMRGQNLHWELVTMQGIGRTWASFQVRWKGSDQRRDAIHLMFEPGHAGCHVENGWRGSMCGKKEPGQEALAVTHRRGCDLGPKR